MEVQKTENIKEENEAYITKMSNILNCCCGYPRGITPLLDFLFLGAEDDAKNVSLLKQKGVTHIINCASSYIHTGPKFYDQSIKKYIEFRAEDEEGYDIMEHFSEAYKVIEDARQTGGKALIHCIMGINRSGALATAYVMLHKRCGPISAVKFVKAARKGVLTNDSFRAQLVDFARERELLAFDKDLLQE